MAQAADVEIRRKQVCIDVAWRDALEHPTVGRMLALSPTGYVTLMEDSRLVNVIVPTNEQQLLGHTVHAAAIITAVTGTTTGGSMFVVLLHADGMMECIASGKTYVATQVSLNIDALRDEELDIYMACLTAATNTVHPEVFMIADEESPEVWCRFSGAGPLQKQLHVPAGSVHMFVGPLLHILSPADGHMLTAIDGELQSTHIAMHVPKYRDWNIAHHFNIGVGPGTNFVAVLTECALLLYQIWPGAMPLVTVYNLIDPTDVQYVAGVGLLMTVMLGQLLVATVTEKGGENPRVVANMPAMLLHMYSNYTAGTLLRCHTPNKYTVLACNTRKIYLCGSSV